MPETCPCCGQAIRRPTTEVRTPKLQRPGSISTHGWRAADASARRRMVGWNDQHALILNALYRAHPRGLTNVDMEAIAGIRPNGHRTRRLELEESGWTRQTDRRRETPTGGTAVVHVLTDEAVAILAQSYDR
jgi:hypothetical protein